ncbi:MAG: CRISPR-associated protein Cas5h [Petrotoga sp.]|nr:CRISPR-associated protein Cas5h [Petrotoga sp.]
MAYKQKKIDFISFTLRGKIAHFRQPDTTITHATYPFPPRPTLHGLIGAILGIDSTSLEWKEFLNEEHYLGLSLLSPIRTVCVQLSLLGKGFLSSGKEFNRPTAVELVISPAYRVYYAGERLMELSEKIRNCQSVFPTYLGSAYCLTFPEYDGCYTGNVIEHYEKVSLSTVVPHNIVEKIYIEEGLVYAAARSMPYKHNGDRTFNGTTTVYYEVNGKKLRLKINQESSFSYLLLEIPGGETICLW